MLQLVGADQSDVSPSHVASGAVTVNIPVASAKKVGLIVPAADVLPPYVHTACVAPPRVRPFELLPVKVLRFSCAPVSTIRGAVMVLSPLRVTDAVPQIITPPENWNNDGNSKSEVVTEVVRL